MRLGPYKETIQDRDVQRKAAERLKREHRKPCATCGGRRVRQVSVSASEQSAQGRRTIMDAYRYEPCPDCQEGKPR